MKKWLVLLIILFCGSLAYCEKLPDADYKKAINPKDNPIIFAYIKDYAYQLSHVFDAKKVRWPLVCSNVNYTLYKDGTISKPKTYFQTPLDQYVKKLIKNNLPPPFPKEMEVEQVKIDMYFCKYKCEEDCEDICFFFYNSESGFKIHIDKLVQ
jgi:hypothetical protein